MDDQIFVLNNMTIQYEILKGHPAITFNGATEWAIDYIFQIETVWFPREGQLREIIMNELTQRSDRPMFGLTNKPGGYICTIKTSTGAHSFEGDTASDAYAETILYLIR